jgi:hypothetical protein
LAVKYLPIFPEEHSHAKAPQSTPGEVVAAPVLSHAGD